MMNGIEGQGIRYWCDHTPEYGTITDILPGIRWLRLPLPFKLDHVNVWILDGEDDTAVVDCGLNRETSREIWSSHLGNSIRLPDRLVVTHYHPDHFGLAGWLGERSGAGLSMPAREWDTGNRIFAQTDEDTRSIVLPYYRRHGLDDCWLSKLKDRGNSYRDRMGPPPADYSPVAAGDRIELGGRSWQAHTFGGHSPEHLMLFDPAAAVLISGDQVLPRISTNVSVWPGDPDADPLSEFLDSLAALDGFDDEILVLPSHGRPFKGIGRRCAELTRHHDDRLNDLLEACAKPRTAADLLPVLFRRELDVHQIGFAMNEAVAHINYLKNRGALNEDGSGDSLVYLRA